MEQRARDLSGKPVSGKDDGFESVERRQRFRELSGEVVVVEEERSEVYQTREVRD